MVPLFVITALAAVPIIVWFFRRTPKRESNAKELDLSAQAANERAGAPNHETPRVQAEVNTEGARVSEEHLAPPAEADGTLLTQPDSAANTIDSSVNSSIPPDVEQSTNELPRPELSNYLVTLSAPGDANSSEEPPVTEPPEDEKDQRSDLPTGGIDCGAAVSPHEDSEPFDAVHESADGKLRTFVDDVQDSVASIEDIELPDDGKTSQESEPLSEEPLADGDENGLPAVSVSPESNLPAIQEEDALLQAENDNNTAPRRYRPPPQQAPRRQISQGASQRPAVKNSIDLPYEVSVRLLFDRFEYCTMTLLPERKPDLDGEVDVRHRGHTLRLVGQEDWYEDLQFNDMGSLLSNGLELNGTLEDNRRVRWLLAGRDIFVFASHPRVSGLLSSSRLALGRSHVVVCAEPVLAEVENILASAGCHQYVKFGSELGLPKGWTGIKRVRPTKPVPLADGIDAFYAVKPATDVDIDLEGGICIRNSAWLAGFPPRIRLLGDTSSVGRVLIDGRHAEPAADGTYSVEGCELAGEHEIICEGLSRSRSYSIEEAPTAWDTWAAYRSGMATLCGPLVQAGHEGRRLISVPMTNPLLLGAEPGQIFRCAPRPGSIWTGYVPFDVAWALPAQPLICKKKESRILQIGSMPLLPLPAGKPRVLRWCSAILDAGRKGLHLHEPSAEGSLLWKEYKKAARNYWRAAK